MEGFKKEDFRVHVDGEGRLTVIGHRKPTPGGGDGKALRLHKTFQLPNTANLDTITGRFDSNVLTLTVPKLPAVAGAAAPAPQAMEEARVAGDKAADQEDKQAQETGERVAKAAEERTTSLTARSKEAEDVKKAKPTAAAAPPQPSEKSRGDHQDDDKARADHREKVSREATRRIEAARARVAEAKAKAERERQCEHWKERAMEEGMKLADAVSKKKEVIATAVAAFTLGVFVSSRLFSRN